MKHLNLFTISMAGALFFAASGAQASGINFEPPQSALQDALVVLAISDSELPFATPSETADAQLLTADELGEQRGGTDLIVASQTMKAITSGNLINGNYTAGAVSLSDNALSGFNGVGNLLINTGGQVSLQAGMNLVITVGD